MPYNFAKRPKNKDIKNCVCSYSRYVVPRHKDIRSCLLSLTLENINILRPFYVYFEEHKRKSHGYQVKCCPIKEINMETSERGT